MAFLDDIGKKISQAGQTAVQKTRNVADIARINSAISDEEKRLNEAYIVLGKLYVDRHAADADEAFAPSVAAAQECCAKIADYKQQIKDIKGVTICEKCGGEIPLGNAFCGACGAAVAAAAVPAAADKVTCTRCGAPVDKAMRFCTSCGNPMGENTPTAKPAEEPAVIVQPQQPTAETATEEAVSVPTAVCAHCGAALLEGAAFCVECGTSVVAQASQPAATCPNCGSALRDGALFCTECGSRL